MRKAYSIFIGLIFGITFLKGQGLSQSPYSQFGFGEQLFLGFADQHAMGQTGTADRNPLKYSVLNSASYSALEKTNYRFGMLGQQGTLNQGDRRMRVNGAGLAYLTLGFQLNKKKDWGFVMGAMPYSVRGYNVEVKIDSSFGTITQQVQGEGGTYRLFAGTGKRIGNHLSVGVQGSFIGGQSSTIRTLLFPSNAPYSNYRTSSSAFVYGFQGESGIQYWIPAKLVYKKSIGTGDQKRTVKDTVRFKHQFGINYVVSTKMDATRSDFARTFVLSGSREQVRDTIFYSTRKEQSAVSLPWFFNAGYQIQDQNGQWRLALEWRQGGWSTYTSTLHAQSTTINNWQFSSGFCFRPSMDFFNSGKKIFAKTEYRFGFRTGILPITPSGQSIPETGFSFGLGIPLRTRTVNEDFRFETVFSSLDISAEYFTRGTLNQNLIREEYFRIAVGVSLNDKWFNKRKIE